jgi:MFS family permease
MTASVPKTPHQTAELKQSLRMCVREGIVSQVMIGIFDYYLIPLAVFLNASTEQNGLLISIPSLLAAFSQFFAVMSVEKMGGRKRLLLKGALIQAIFLIPIAFLVLFHFKNQMGVLIIFVTVFRVIGSLIGPAWGSLVSDYLPNNLRGEYFGHRSQLVAISGLLNLWFWGIFLTAMNKISIATGFFVIFVSAAIARFISAHYLSRMIELPTTHNPAEERFTFWMFIRRFRESNFVKYIFYISSITFAVQLSAAYFNVYMLRDLKLTYTNYMLVNLSSMLIGLLIVPIWGRHADAFGNVKILKLTGLLIGISPLFWIFAQQPWQLMLIEAFSGMVWGGFNLCSANFIYDAVSPPKRVQCLGYFNLINGLAVFAGAGLGGYLADKLPPLNGSPLLTLFFISSILRFAAHGLLASSFKEVRTEIGKVRSVKLFLSVLGVRPIMGLNLEWPIFSKLRFKRQPIKNILP